MLEKFFEKVDMLIEVIKGDDPVVDQMLLDDFEYHYSCNVRFDDVWALAQKREKEEKEKEKELNK